MPSALSTGLTALLLSSPGLLAQALLQAPEVTAPSGYTSTPTAFLASGGDFFDGLDIGISASFGYDSNVRQSPGLPVAPIEDDIFYTISPQLRYRTVGTDWFIGANASLDYTSYLDDSDLGGLGYTLGVQFGYEGNPLKVTGQIGSSYRTGVNRYYNSQSVDTLNFNASLAASYRWSAKTNFDARLGFSSSEPDGAAFGGTQNTNFDMAAMWRATPLFRVGPGIGWTLQTGDRQGDRETIGPIVRTNYQLSDKIAVDGTFGLDFVDGPGGSDTAFSMRLGANYRASALWGMNLSLYRGTQADVSRAGQFRETSSVRLGYYRKIRRVNLALGVSYETNDYSNNLVVAGGPGDYLSFDASLGMLTIRERVQASLFYQYNDQSGGNRDWDGYRVGVSLNSSF